MSGSVAERDVTRRAPWTGLRLTDDVALIVVWAAIGLATAQIFGYYTPGGMWLVAFGTAALVCVVACSAPHRRLSVSPIVVVVGAGSSLYIALTATRTFQSAGPWLTASKALVGAAAILLMVWCFLRLPLARLCAILVIGLMFVAGVALIHASPYPQIDVWYEIQAVCHALSHGQDIYQINYASQPGPGEIHNGYAYLPLSAVALWPFQALFGDYRYGLVVAFALTGLLVVAISGKRSTVALLAGLVLLYPQALWCVQEGWVDPLSLLAICATGYALIRGRFGSATVAFAVFLAMKQYNWLLVPLAVVVPGLGVRRTATAAGLALVSIAPWVIVDPHAFYETCILFTLRLPIAGDSLSLISLASRHGTTIGGWLTVVATLAALVLAVWRIPRSVSGFFLGSGLVMAVYDLTYKRSFFNEWQFAADLVLLAVVFAQVEGATSGEPMSANVTNVTESVGPFRRA